MAGSAQIEGALWREVQRTNQLLEHLIGQIGQIQQALAAATAQPVAAGRPTPPWQQPAQG